MGNELSIESSIQHNKEIKIPIFVPQFIASFFLMVCIYAFAIGYIIWISREVAKFY
jgi:quinol-cytochrome oxidoreductase complex cytochrome b subunit